MIIRLPFGKRVFVGIVGVAFLAIGIVLFSRSFEIIPFLVSTTFLVTGCYAIYFALFYRITINQLEICTGNKLYNSCHSVDDIEGYFEYTQANKKYSSTEILILKFYDGSNIYFDDSTLGKNYKILRREISGSYKKLGIKVKDDYLIRKKHKWLTISSYIGIVVFLFGTFQFANYLLSDYDYIEIECSLRNKPSFVLDRRNRISRINIETNEFPSLTFSQVKNAFKFLEWQSSSIIGDRVILEITKKDHENIIINENVPKVSVNYPEGVVELKRLKHSTGQYIYKENPIEERTLPLVIMLLGLLYYLYCIWKIKRL